MKIILFSLLGLLLLGICAFFQASLGDASQIVIEDADTIWHTSSEYSLDLVNATNNVSSRITAEYTNSIFKNELNILSDLINFTNNLSPRIVIEYANSIYHHNLAGMPNNLLNLIDRVVARVIVEYANSFYHTKFIFPKDLMNDTLSPIITNVSISDITANSVIIKWNTNELADSLIKYGIGSGIYTKNQNNSLFVTNHTIVLYGLSPHTTYYFVLSSTDQSGNSAESSEYSFITLGPKIDVNVSLSIIPEDTDDNPMLCLDNQVCDEVTNITVNITDTSSITSATINLSSLGWSTIPLTHIQGTDTWYVMVNAIAGTAVHDGTKYIPYGLVIIVTDEEGYWNTDIANVTVWKNGDASGDGIITLYDATYLAKWYFNQPGFEYLPENVADVSGDCQITLYDATYLAKWYFNQPGFGMLK